MRNEATSYRVEDTGPELASPSGLFGAGDVRCRGEPDGRPRENQYACPAIGVVVSGVFDYRSAFGEIAATPGTILLGNAGEAFSYLYHDAHEVRRSVIALHSGLLAEIAIDCDLDDAEFGTMAIAPSRHSATLYGAVRRAAAGRCSPEAVLGLAAAALTLGRRSRLVGATPAERRRVRDVIQYIDQAYAEPCSLDELAGMAQLSRYHFIRVFRGATGENPHQYLMGARLRAAADLLIDSALSVTSVALSVGFNDISHFNDTFRKAYGLAPRAWRALPRPDESRARRHGTAQ